MDIILYADIMIFRYFHLLLNRLEHIFFIMIHLQISTLIACVNVWTLQIREGYLTSYFFTLWNIQYLVFPRIKK